MKQKNHEKSGELYGVMRGEGKCERKKAKGARREEGRWDKGKLRA